MDTDCTISFSVGGRNISMDVYKQHQAIAIQAYKCLVALCRQQQKNLRHLNFAKQQVHGIQISLPTGADVGSASTQALASWTNYAIQTYDPESYLPIFQQFFP